MIARVLLVSVLVLAACKQDVQEDTGPPDLSGFDPNALAEAEAACSEAGGNWGQGGFSSGFVCIQPTRDANRRCTRGTDCEGLCLARSQSCAPVTPFFGCHEVLTDSGVRSTLCID